MADPPPPHGSWPSPITASLLVEGAASVGELRVDGPDVWWGESRPSEGGRTQLVRRTPDGRRHDVLPDGANARTRVHEYGGGAWCVAGGVVTWNDWADQRLRSLAVPAAASAEPVLLTPEPAEPHGWRHADLVASADGRWIVGVREAHGRPGTTEAVNELVAVPTDGSAADDPDRIVVLVTGPDFVSSPRLGPGGRWLAWTQWSHPDMPWDGTELWVARLDPATAAVTDVRKVAGGRGESIVQPEWVPDGTGERRDDRPRLVACSDRTGWWNLSRWTIEADEAGRAGGADGPAASEPVALAPIEAEVGGPQWVFGERWYAVGPGGRIVASAASGGRDRLLVVEPDGDGPPAPVELPFTSIGQLAVDAAGDVLAVAAGPASEPAPVRIRLHADGRPTTSGTTAVEVLRPARDLGFGPEWFSAPEVIEFPTSGGATAHGLLYRPRNPEVAGPGTHRADDGRGDEQLHDDRPPLLVFSHGGPTAAARPMLQLGIQFWTTRGFVVVDVDYRGSTGYGRPYRDALKGEWGVVDVDDCVAAARYLADRGEVDPDRLAIRGGSAGGFTTLAALAFHDTFAAGCSRYGVADLEALATDTHKFESRYLDSLVGPWPEAKATYDERSPINHVDGFDRPLLVLQGSEDEVVPPAQSEMIVAALADKGVPHAYVLFEGEQHGFRRAEHIVAALEAELWFYGRVFGFDPADDLPPLDGAVGL